MPISKRKKHIFANGASAKSAQYKSILTCWYVLFILSFCLVPLLLIKNIPHWSIALVVLCIVIGYCSKGRYFAWILFAAALAMRIAVVTVIQTPQISDFKALLDAAARFASGDMGFVQEDFFGIKYFHAFPFQLGFVAYEGIILRIFHTPVWLAVINGIVGAGSTVFVYLIAKQFCGEGASRGAAILYCIHPFGLFYVTVLTNQFMAAFLSYLAIWLLVRNGDGEKRGIYCVFGALTALANVIRPEGIIPIFSVALYLLLTMDKTNVKDKLIRMFSAVASYVAVNKLVSFIFCVTGILSNGLSNGNPYYKFLFGLNIESGGAWSASDFAMIPDRDMCRNVLAERVSEIFAGGGARLSVFLPIKSRSFGVADPAGGLWRTAGKMG